MANTAGDKTFSPIILVISIALFVASIAMFVLIPLFTTISTEDADKIIDVCFFFYFYYLLNN